MGSEGPVAVKSEPDWASFRSSYDATQHNSPALQNGTVMPAAMPQMYHQPPGIPGPIPDSGPAKEVNNQTKKKGRPKKVKEEPSLVGGVSVKQEQITGSVKVKKKRDRFKGMTEEEVLQKVLPDHIRPGLDILIIGINPGLTAAYVGHHYAGPGNHFWKCLFLSGLIPQQMNAYDDSKLQEYGIGFTNIVERTSRGSADLTKKEIKEGGEILMEKVKKYKPKIAVFNGKGIYEVFCGHKNFHIGKQPDPFPGCEETSVFVMPSSSARFTQLPRAIDKVPFYLALKKYRDHLCGKLPELRDEEIYFPDLNLKVVPKAERLAEIARQEAESGQLLIKPEHKLQDGETKPKRGRKKSPVASNQAPQFNVVNEPPLIVKSEPGEGSTDRCTAQNAQDCTEQNIQTSNTSKSTIQNLQVCQIGQNTQGMGTQSTENCSTLNSQNSSVEDLLAGGGTLVKQEDDRELAKFGIYSHHLNTASAMLNQFNMCPPTTGSGQYWPQQPYSGQGTQGFVRPGLTFNQALQQNCQPITSPYHPNHAMMYTPNTSLPQQTNAADCTVSLPTNVSQNHCPPASTSGQQAADNNCQQTTTFSQFNVRPSLNGIEMGVSSSSHSAYDRSVSLSTTASSPGTTTTTYHPHYSMVKQEADITPQPTSHPYWNQFS